jgi:UDP-N-acetylmuramoyl-tripeptide--D-alanyl-D-alanine ligase
MRFMAADVAHATRGRLVGHNAHLSGVSFDSRTLLPGQLFVPVVADRDGHEFIAAARSGGAGAYLTMREPEGGTAIVVDDTVAALARLAGWARHRLSTHVAGRVVGITGSVGKTSTKDLVAAALGATIKVLMLLITGLRSSALLAIDSKVGQIRYEVVSFILKSSAGGCVTNL